MKRSGRGVRAIVLILVVVLAFSYIPALAGEGSSDGDAGGGQSAAAQKSASAGSSGSEENADGEQSAAAQTPGQPAVRKTPGQSAVRKTPAETGDASVKVIFNWSDYNNTITNEGTRPDQLELTLLRDGEEVLDKDGQPITLTVSPNSDEDKNWRVEFKDLPKLTSGKYSVRLGDISDRYKYNVTQYHAASEDREQGRIPPG